MKLRFYACLFFVASSAGPRPAFRRLQKAGWGPGTRPFPLYRTASDGKLGKRLETRLHFFDCKGYRVVLDSAVLSITGMIFLTRPNLIPSPPR